MGLVAAPPRQDICGKTDRRSAPQRQNLPPDRAPTSGVWPDCSFRIFKTPLLILASLLTDYLRFWLGYCVWALRMFVHQAFARSAVGSMSFAVAVPSRTCGTRTARRALSLP
jgi:hypothetical protein